MTTTTEQIRNAANLDELLTLVRGFREETLEDERLMAELPTFGGAAPRSTSGVWSWDESRLLVGTCASDLRIVARQQ